MTNLGKCPQRARELMWCDTKDSAINSGPWLMHLLKLLLVSTWPGWQYQYCPQEAPYTIPSRGSLKDTHHPRTFCFGPPLKQQSLAFLALGIISVEDIFYGLGWSGCFGMIQVHYIHCAIYFYYHHVSSILNHQALDPEVGDHHSKALMEFVLLKHQKIPSASPSKNDLSFSYV